MIGCSVGFLSKPLFFPNLQISISSGIEQSLRGRNYEEIVRDDPCPSLHLGLISPDSVFK